MEALSAAILADRRRDSDQSCPPLLFHQADEAVAPGAIDAQGTSRDRVRTGMCAHEPQGRSSGVSREVPCAAVAPGADDEVERESACKPGSVESSHSSAMRVAAHL